MFRFNFKIQPDESIIVDTTNNYDESNLVDQKLDDGTNKNNNNDNNNDNNDNKNNKNIANTNVLQKPSSFTFADSRFSNTSRHELPHVAVALSPLFTVNKLLTSGDRGVAATSDVVRGEYEGGQKVWECSIDLAQYVTSLDLDFSSISVYAKRRLFCFCFCFCFCFLFRLLLFCVFDVQLCVRLELGAGHGLPGVVCLLRGAKQVRFLLFCFVLFCFFNFFNFLVCFCKVTFQDLNRDVLESVTAANVALNVDDVAPSQCCAQFVAGDWHSLLESQVDNNLRLRADLVLAAETIYALESLPSFVRLLRAALAPRGTALIAAKQFYFGVGGGCEK